LAWCGVGIVALVISLNTLGGSITLAENPRFWPVFASLTMIAGGVGIGVVGYLRTRESDPSHETESVEDADDTSSQAEGEPVIRRWNHVVLLASMFAYAVVIPHAGYFLSTLILMMVCLWSMGIRTVWKFITIALVFSAST